MRRLLLPILCLGMMAMLLYSAHGEGVLAVVNSDVITVSQVRDFIDPKEKQACETWKGQELVEKIKALRSAGVAELIDRTLILQSAKTQGLSIREAAIDERIQSVIDTQFGGDRARFLKDITARGYTLASFRDLQRDDLMVERMRAAETSNASTPEEAKQREVKWLHGLHQRAYIKIY